jgi:hypothetical protein
MGAKGWLATSIRFANANVGWAFGDAFLGNDEIYVTSDGGASWSEDTQLPCYVEDLVAANGQAFAVVDTTPYNTVARAQFAIFTTSYGQGTQHWTRVPLPIDLGETTPSIVDQDGTITILASGPPRSGNRDHVLVAAPGGAFVDHIGPCYQDLGGYLSNSASGVWAICPTGHMAGVAVSTDRGASWKTVSNLPPPSFPDPGRGGVGAIDDTHALVYDFGTTSLVRISVGSSPVPVTSGPTTTGVGTLFIGFTTPSIGFVVAVHENSTRELWRTTDGGLHWTIVQVGS